MMNNREPIPRRWELIQSVCFNDDIFLCLLRGQDEKYFSFISENSKIKNFHKFEELEDDFGDEGDDAAALKQWLANKMKEYYVGKMKY